MHNFVFFCEQRQSELNTEQLRRVTSVNKVAYPNVIWKIFSRNRGVAGRALQSLLAFDDDIDGVGVEWRGKHFQTVSK